MTEYTVCAATECTVCAKTDCAVTECSVCAETECTVCAETECTVCLDFMLIITHGRYRDCHAELIYLYPPWSYFGSCCSAHLTRV